MSKLKEIIHQYVVEALQEILSEEGEQISEMNYQDDKFKLIKTYPAQSDKHDTAKVYKNRTNGSNEPYHIQVIRNGKIYEPGEGFADDEEDAHNQAKQISGHPVKESVNQISELSVDALDGYMRAAKKRIRGLHPALKGSPDSPREKEIEKRVKNVHLARLKLNDKV